MEYASEDAEGKSKKIPVDQYKLGNSELEEEKKEQIEEEEGVFAGTMGNLDNLITRFVNYVWTTPASS